MINQNTETPMHLRETNSAGSGWCSRVGNFLAYSLVISGPIPSRQLCDEINATRDDNERHLYSWHNYQRFRLLEDGRVLFEDGRTEEGEEKMVEVTDEAILQQIRNFPLEDRQIELARQEVAVQRAKEDFSGDTRAVTMFCTALAFNCFALEQEDDNPYTQPTSKNGISFYQVGRNASHSFYMGMKLQDDGEIHCYSGAYGEEFDEKTREWDHVFTHHEVDSWSGGYYGHF